MYATISFSRAVNMLKKGPPPHFSMDILRSEGLTSKHARASRTAANMAWKQCMQKCVAQGLRQGRRHSLLQRRQKRPRQGLQKLQNLSIHRQIRCGLHAGAMVCDFGKGHWQYLGPGLMAMFLTLQRDSLLAPQRPHKGQRPPRPSKNQTQHAILQTLRHGPNAKHYRITPSCQGTKFCSMMSLCKVGHRT